MCDFTIESAPTDESKFVTSGESAKVDCWLYRIGDCNISVHSANELLLPTYKTLT